MSVYSLNGHKGVASIDIDAPAFRLGSRTNVATATHLAPDPRPWYITGVYQTSSRSRLRPEALLPAFALQAPRSGGGIAAVLYPQRGPYAILMMEST